MKDSRIKQIENILQTKINKRILNQFTMDEIEGYLSGLLDEIIG